MSRFSLLSWEAQPRSSTRKPQTPPKTQPTLKSVDVSSKLEPGGGVQEMMAGLLPSARACRRVSGWVEHAVGDKNHSVCNGMQTAVLGHCFLATATQVVFLQRL